MEPGPLSDCGPGSLSLQSEQKPVPASAKDRGVKYHLTIFSMKPQQILLALLAGTLLFPACSEQTPEPDEKDATAHITVLDEDGTPLGGVPVLIYDEKGYEKFRENRDTEPNGITLTLPDGKVNYRLPYQNWFPNGSRVVVFVIREESDPDNYRTWAVGRTIKAGEQVRIDFKLDRNTGSSPGVEPSGSLLDLFDEDNGRTLFGNAVYLDAAHNFIGGGRYSFVDAGEIAGIEALGDLSLDGVRDKAAAHLRHGYFICKDIALMEFPSGKWGFAISSEYAKVHVEEWLTRDGKNVGVKLRYSMHSPETHGLPEWEHLYEVKRSDDGSVTIPLPADDADTECAPWGDTPLRFSFAADHVTVHIADPETAPGKEYRFVIRSGASYTEAKLRITD